MRSAKFTSRKPLDQAFTAFGSYSPDGLTEDAIDALIAQVDKELAAEEQVMTTRLRCSFTDSRAAHRTTRRNGRAVLRSLPGRMEDIPVESEAA